MEVFLLSQELFDSVSLFGFFETGRAVLRNDRKFRLLGKRSQFPLSHINQWPNQPQIALPTNKQREGGKDGR